MLFALVIKLFRISLIQIIFPIFFVLMNLHKKVLIFLKEEELLQSSPLLVYVYCLDRVINRIMVAVMLSVVVFLLIQM